MATKTNAQAGFFFQGNTGLAFSWQQRKGFRQAMALSHKKISLTVETVVASEDLSRRPLRSSHESCCIAI